MISSELVGTGLDRIKCVCAVSNVLADDLEITCMLSRVRARMHRYWTFSAVFLQFMKRASNCATGSKIAVLNPKSRQPE